MPQITHCSEASSGYAAQILIIMSLLVRILSVLPAMAGLGVTILLIPATTLLARKQAAIRKVLSPCDMVSCCDVMQGLNGTGLGVAARGSTELLLQMHAMLARLSIIS